MITPAIGMLGPWELGIILVIVLIFFGVGKLPQIFGQLGLGIKAFKDAQKDEAIDATPGSAAIPEKDVEEAKEV